MFLINICYRIGSLPHTVYFTLLSVRFLTCWGTFQNWHSCWRKIIVVRCIFCHTISWIFELLHCFRSIVFPPIFQEKSQPVIIESWSNHQILLIRFLQVLFWTQRKLHCLACWCTWWIWYFMCCRLSDAILQLQNCWNASQGFKGSSVYVNRNSKIEKHKFCLNGHWNLYLNRRLLPKGKHRRKECICISERFLPTLCLLILWFYTPE